MFGFEASSVLLIIEVPSLIPQFAEQLWTYLNEEEPVKRKECLDRFPEAESMVLHFVISSNGNDY